MARRAGNITGNRVRGTIRVDGLREAIALTSKVGDRARKPEPALRGPSTLRDLQASEKRRFDKQKGWAKLTPRWAAEKRRRGLSSGILRATGRLERALTTGTKPHGIRFTVYNATLTWGIRRGRGDLYYAQPLATGTSHMKARQMIVIDVPAQDSIRDRVGSYVAHGVIAD